MEMEKQKTGFWETLILIAIILVIGQTFLEELSVLRGWSVKTRHLLIFSGLFFDLLFTIEYLVRQIRAAVRKEGVQYFLRGRGWIDLISSVPLLLLNSLPHTLSIVLASSGDYGALPAFANLMKVVKAVRITRVLRFIRMIKLFGKIHNADSVMAQRHISRLASLLVLSIIAVLIAGSFLGTGTDETAVRNARTVRFTGMAKNAWRYSFIAAPADTVSFAVRAGKAAGITPFAVTNSKGEPVTLRSALTTAQAHQVLALLHRKKGVEKLFRPGYLASMLSGERYCISVSLAGRGRIFQTVKEEMFQRYFDRDDYFSFSTGGMIFRVSLKDVRRSEAVLNMLSLVLILVVVLCLILIYTKHFAQTVSDVIHVMRRGMSEPDYNLQVKIREQFKDDEVFQLAELYNDEWLSVKDKYRPLEGRDAEKKVSGITLDDFFGNNSV